MAETTPTIEEAAARNYQLYLANDGKPYLIAQPEAWIIP